MRRIATLAMLLVACLALGAAPARANRELLSEKALHTSPGPPSKPPPEAQIEGACGLAVISGGSIYVSDYYHRAVDVFSSDGAYESQIALPGSNPAFGTNTLDAVCGLAITPAGVLYANELHQAALRLRPSEQVFDEAESTGVAVDAAGHVYVDDRTDVAVYEPSGEPVLHEGQPLQIGGAGNLQDAYGVAVSASGARVYVADAGEDKVKVFEPAGDPATPVATISHGFVSLTDAALAVDPSNEHLLVVDNLQPGFEHPKAAVDEFDSTGAFLGRLPGAPVFGEPSGIAADPASGKLYVTSGNSEEANVFAYSPFSASILGPSGFAAPVGGSGTSSAPSASSSPPSSSAAAKRHRRRGAAHASEVTQHGKLRVAFAGSIAPKRLPRQGSAPVSASLGGQISTSDGSDPPQLRRVRIAINSHAHLDPAALPPCRIADIDPSTSAGALQACRRSLVGEGSFSANVKLPSQSPFPSQGKVLAFNGVSHGRPVILAHIFGTDPVPTSIVLPFAILAAKGAYATILQASLPQVTGDWGYVTGLSLRLERRFSSHGPRRAYLSAGCPAPKGFPGAVFALMRTSFDFAGGVKLSSVLTRSCKAR
jgi:DNA-binding beta-propeller fold protein YncE